MFRLYFMTFHGRSRLTEEAKHHLHESPNSMTIPLMILAVLSLAGGFIQLPLMEGGQRLSEFLAPVFMDVAHVGEAAAAAHGAEHAGTGLEIALMVISLVVAASGIFLAYRFYMVDPEAPARLAERMRGLYRLVFNKYWVDEIYNDRIVEPIRRGSIALWEKFDAAVIDGAVNGVGRQIERGAGLLRQAQTGSVQVYAMVITLGLVVVLGYLALR
jgi:NADH-quinone oxidoreductase subunit L